MVQIKNKKGFIQLLFNPITIIVLLLIGGVMVWESHDFNLPTLAIGIEDGYSTYDDFDKGYFDNSLFTVTNQDMTARYSRHNYDPNLEPDIKSGWAVFTGKLCHPGSISASYTGFIKGNITPTENFYGKHIKLKYTVGQGQIGEWSNQVEAKIYLNDVMVANPNPGYGRWKEETYLVELIPSFEDYRFYQVRINGEDSHVVDTTNPTGETQFRIEFSKFHLGCSVPESYSFKLDYIKTKYAYSDKLPTDEVIVYDEFGPDTTINLTAGSLLTFEPTRFYQAEPVRDHKIGEGFRKDERAELLTKLVNGKNVVVPEGHIYTVYYATKWKPEMGPRCDFGQSLSPDGECESTVEKAIVGCTSSADCFIPEGCFGLSATCEDFSCQYQGKCEEQYVDHCLTDSECQAMSPCPGVTYSCADPDGFGARCIPSGKCQNFQCVGNADCEGLSPCDGVHYECQEHRCEPIGSCIPVEVEKTIIEQVIMEKTIVEDRIVEKPVTVEKQILIPVEVYQDQCDRDSDCTAPCPGMSANCEDNGQFKECTYGGKCEEKIVRIKSQSWWSKFWQSIFSIFG